MPLPAALESTWNMSQPPPNEQKTTHGQGAEEQNGQRRGGEGDEGGEIEPVDPEFEGDGGEDSSETVDRGEEDGPAGFWKTLELPGKNGHGAIPLNPRIPVWHGVFWCL